MKIRIRSGLLAIVIPAVLFGSIALTSALGLWRTTTDKIPARYTSGSAAGEYNPMDIKGSYDFGTISDLFGIPLADLANAFLVPEGTDAAAFQVKSLEEVWSEADTGGLEVGTDSVRLFVAFFKGLPIDMADTTGLPDAAADIVLAKGAPTDEQKAFLLTHRVSGIVPGVGEEAASPAVSSAASPAAATGEETERKIKGTTTWKEVLDWGVPQAELEAAVGGEIRSLSSLIKNDCAARGVEFSSVKGQLQVLVDALPD